MILLVDSDVSFLVSPEAKSRIAGYFHFPQTTKSASILIECLTLKNIVTPATEFQTAGVFDNTQTVIPIQCILREIGHP